MFEGPQEHPIGVKPAIDRDELKQWRDMMGELRASDPRWARRFEVGVERGVERGSRARRTMQVGAAAILCAILFMLIAGIITGFTADSGSPESSYPDYQPIGTQTTADPYFSTVATGP
jgi:hypothetical protein